MIIKGKSCQQIKQMRYTLYVIILLLSVISYYLFIPPTPSLQDQVSPTISLYPAQKIINLSLINDKQQTLGLNKVAKDKWLLLYFGYTSCPDVCPVDLAIIAQSFKMMKHKTSLQVVFISVDPKNDLGHLDDYAQRFHTDFIGATLENEKLAATTKNLGVYYEVANIQKTAENKNHQQHHKKQNKLINHTASYLLLNPKHALVGVLTSPHDKDKIAIALDKVIAY